MERHFLSLICCLIASLTIGSAIPLDSDLLESNETLPDYRLSGDIQPINYNILIRPYFHHENESKAFTFDGTVKISLQATRANVQVITLHKTDLNISKESVELRSFPYTKLKIVSTTYNNVTEKYSLTLDRALRQGREYYLTFEYTGHLQTDMHGFYSSSYEENNSTKWLASTQFEPVHARKAFPCFDEPRFKAIFQLNIDRPTTFEPTLANTPIKSSNVVFNDGVAYTRDTFYDTPKMSTYLVAFIVSEFKCRENNDKTFQVCARPNAYNQTKYSFDVGQLLLSQLEKLFDYPYKNHGIGKLTMAAIPDFNAGAMENWGLLTYRETALLYDSLNPSKVAKNRIASVVAHEQAHLWFGDLVTCDWWEHTWLNEGFARFFQYFITSTVETDFQLNEAFVVEQVHSVFGFDGTNDTHALSQEVNSPAEISVMFDSISYNKGASVIRMLQHVIGNDSFTNGLRKYLKERSFNTAVPNDLYKALQSSTVDGHDVEIFMDSWIEQKGYPIVMVNVTNNRTNAEVTQRRFFLKNADLDDKTKYEVPITYAHAGDNSNFNNTKPRLILSAKADSVVLEFSDPIEWIVFNVKQTGFYRVEYDAVTLDHIIAFLKSSHAKIDVLNRAQIVDDALALARSGHSTFPRAFQVMEYLKHETDPLPWFSAINHLNFLLTRYTPDQDTNFKNHIAKLIHHVYHHVVHANETAEDFETQVYNSKAIAYSACQFGVGHCVSDAKEEFAKFIKGNYSIPADLRLAYYCTGIQHGSAVDWQQLWDKFEEENVSSEQMIILSALGCTTNHELITYYLDLILTSKVRRQDKNTAFLATLRGRGNVDHVFHYIRDNHANITAAFGSPNAVTTLLSSAAGYFTTDEQLKKLEEFGAVLESPKPIESAIKNVKYNLEWAKFYLPAVESIVKPSNPDKPKPPQTPGSGAGSTVAVSFLAIVLVSINFINSFLC